MSEKTEITAQLIEKISEQISQENTAKLQDLISDLHVADIAEILEELKEELKKLMVLNWSQHAMAKELDISSGKVNKLIKEIEKEKI